VASLLHEQVGHVTMLTFNRPEVRNAVDAELSHRFREAVLRALDDSSAVCLRGRGLVFCAGGDVAALAGDEDAALAVMDEMRQTLLSIRQAPVPVIAYVEGLAVGGGAEIAAAADVVCATPGASFQFLQANLRLSPGWGGGTALAERVGRGRALDLLLSARRIGVAEARSLGLVDRVLIPADLPDYLHMPGLQDRDLARAVASSLRADASGAAEAKRTFEALWRSTEHREAVDRFLATRQEH